jgi:hypothetical protein
MGLEREDEADCEGMGIVCGIACYVGVGVEIEEI